MDGNYVLFCLAPGSCWKRPLYGEVIFVILSPVFPVVVGPEGVVVVIRPTVSHVTGLEIFLLFSISVVSSFKKRKMGSHQTLELLNIGRFML